MKKQSRSEEISRKRSERNIFIILTATIALITLFFLYGIPLLINFSLLIGKLKGNNDSEIFANNSSYLAPPYLDPLTDATSSAKIDISGSALKDQVIKLYVNGKFYSKTNVKDDKSFVFYNVSLNEGENYIKAKSVVSGKESDYSQGINIFYKNKAPDLEITYPMDNQTISNGDGRVKVEGKTAPFTRITINDYWAIVNSQGNFSFFLHLEKGENKIKIIATDDADNKTEKEIKIKLE